MTVCQGVRVQPLRRRGLLSAFAPWPVSTPALREFRGMITECERLAEDESSSRPNVRPNAQPAGRLLRSAG